MSAANRIKRRYSKDVDGGSLAAIRIGLGVVLSVGSIRFLWLGWVERCFDTPTFFFKFYGFEWVHVLPNPGMHMLYVAVAALALLFAFGAYYRAVTPLLFATFTYAELIDVTNYLNHYYLVSLMLFIACFSPWHARFSYDAKRRHLSGRVSLWHVDVVRFQVGLVYVFAGLAKLGSDWLIHAQPLGIWLHARRDIWPVGALMASAIGAWVPHLFAWSGFLHDLTMPFLLTRKRVRLISYVILLVFHAGTHLLFNIGIFPFMMPVLATVFFDPGWPSRWLRTKALREKKTASGWWRAPALAIIVLWFGVQIALPLRSLKYPGNVLWNEEGMRFSWRVMVREKNGSVMFRVHRPEGRVLEVPASRYLTTNQEREFSGQPDLIAQLARHVAETHRDNGILPRVTVDAWVSLNGRLAMRLIDPKHDFSLHSPSLTHKDWILPAPTGNPLPAVSR